MRKILLLLLAAVCLQSAYAEEKKLPEEYFLPYAQGTLKLQKGDVVSVSVFGHRDTFVPAVPIAPDGKLYYLFCPGIPAAGRLPEEVATDIENHIRHLFNNPKVTVIPSDFSAKSFNVLGKVNYPGVYPIEAPVTLRQAVAKARGFAQAVYRGSTIEIADLSNSYLLRDGKKLPIDFVSLFKDHDESQDIYVRGGDTIFIASGLGQEVFILGEVNESRAQAYTEGVTLIQLVTGITVSTGGYTKDADLKRVCILRGSLSDPQMFTVNLKDILHGKAPDVYLQPGDIVYVPEKSFLWARVLAEDVVKSFVYTFFGEFGSDTADKYLFEGNNPR